jgi:hypothetical protein
MNTQAEIERLVKKEVARIMGLLAAIKTYGDLVEASAQAVEFARSMNKAQKSTAVILPRLQKITLALAIVIQKSKGKVM